jgi:hypothetical protein
MIYNADSPEKTWTIKWGLHRSTPSLTAVDSVTGIHLAVLMMHEPLRNAFVVSKLARQAIADAGYEPQSIRTHLRSRRWLPESRKGGLNEPGNYKESRH